MAKEQPFKLAQTLVGHNEDVKDVLFLDPSTILSCSRDATVRIWRRTQEDTTAPLKQGGDDAMDTDPPQVSTSAPEAPTSVLQATTSDLQASTSAPQLSTPASVVPTPETETSDPSERRIAGVKPSTGFADKINSNAQGFVNCIAYIKPDAEHTDGLIISAGQESLIDVRPPGFFGPDAAYLLIGHSGNVCALDVYGYTIISGSWDKTAIVWKNWEKKYVLEGHTAAVWAVLAISDTEFITGCADGKIRWFRENKLYRSVQAHTQPVRGLQKLNDDKDGAFISCGNDGVIKSWTKEGREIETVYAHSAYIYSITVLPNGEWASCGEDRNLKIWRKSQCLQTIAHPCISVWCVSAASNGDIVTGASDGVLRTWSRDPERQADDNTLKAYSEAIANLTIAEEAAGVDKESLPGMSALGRPGKSDGEKIHINNEGNVEAYQWSSQDMTWEQVGVVASAVSSGRKVEYNGQFYDYVFDVDFEEGQPPKKLPFNASQNPWDAARIFLERNELPMTYLDTTAGFIIQNTKGTRIGSSEPQLPSSVDPYGIENRYRPGDEYRTSGEGSASAPPPAAPKLLPWKTYLDITNVNLDAATKNILDTNAKYLACGQKDKALNDDDMETLKALTGFLAKPSAPTSASAKKSSAVVNGLSLLIKVITEWEGVKNVAPLDVLRVLARHSPAVVLYDIDIFEILEAAGGFKPGNTSHAVFSIRVFLNSFHHEEGLKYVSEKADTITQNAATVADGSQNRLLAISADTLFLNYAVYFAKNKSKGGEEDALNLLPIVVKRIRTVSDPEALYRAVMALGTLLTIGSKVVSAAKDKYAVRSVMETALQRIDKQKEKRTVDVAAEIEELLLLR
ncbi:hypothetical protein TWF481_006842 [Arthrobotrys musiformis]|uniref:Phospholipase A-2-activating protein n=1 Tax=Arthrobotrys musiformis TaxID=47236 RepID=A0AAV9W9P1_9PEZI